MVKRLHRSALQVASVERLLLDGADCGEVIGELSAAITCLEQAGFALLAGGMSACLQGRTAGDATDAGDPRSEAARRLFARLVLRMP